MTSPTPDDPLPEPAVRMSFGDPMCPGLGCLLTVMGGLVCLVIALDLPNVARGESIVLFCLLALLELTTFGVGVWILRVGGTHTFETDPVRRVVRYEQRLPWGTSTREYRYDDILAIVLKEDNESRTPKYDVLFELDKAAPYPSEGLTVVNEDEADEIEDRLAAAIGCPCYDTPFALEALAHADGRNIAALVAIGLWFIPSVLMVCWVAWEIVLVKMNQAPAQNLPTLCILGLPLLLELCVAAFVWLRSDGRGVATDPGQDVLWIRQARAGRLETRAYPYDTIDAVTVETHAPPNRTPTYGVSIVLHDGRPIATGYRSRDPGKASETATRLARRIGCPCTDATA